MIVRVLAILAVSGSGLWALWPLGGKAVDTAASMGSPGTPPTSALSAQASTTAKTGASRTLDLAAFRAPLWVSPPPPPPPAPPPPPPPPLKLQLLAIVGGGGPGAFKAMLYDPDRDAVLTLSAGEAIGGGRVVERVEKNSVSIRDPLPPGSDARNGSATGLVRTLTLDAGPSGPSGFGGGR